MNIKRTIAAVGVSALLAAGGVLGVATSAMADEPTTPDPAVTAAAATDTPDATPTSDSAPAYITAPAVPASVADPAPDAPAPAPAPAAKPDIAPAVTPAAPQAAPQNRQQPKLVTVWETWQFPDGVTPPTGHQNALQNWFPQTYVGEGQVEPTCGTYYQQDQYVGTQAAIDKLVSGPLTWNSHKSHASDNDVVQVKDWTIVYSGGCPPVVTHQVCTSGIQFGASDGTPVLEPTGWELDGSGVAQGIAGAASAGTTLNSLSGLGYTTTGSDIEGVAYKVAVYLDGTTGFSTLSWEPYRNGEANTGSYSNIEGGSWWGTGPEASAAGFGQSSTGKTLADFEAQWPNAIVLSYGVGLGSAITEGSQVVTSITEPCGSVSFATPQPDAQVTTSTDVNGDANCDAKTISQTVTTWSTDYVWVDGAWVLGTDLSNIHWVSAVTTDVPATDDQLATCPVVVVTPPDTGGIVPPVKTAPAPKPSTSSTPSVDTVQDTSSLAHTGSDQVSWIAIAASILGAGSILMAAGLIARRRRV